jgi:hypothetical protein
MSRRGTTLLGSVALLALAGGAIADGGAAPEQRIAAKPRLLVAALDPLTVRGMSFKARERVTVTLDGGRRGTERVQADRQGRFSARFEFAIPRCRTVTVRATGSMGSRVVYQVPRPHCREP